MEAYFVVFCSINVSCWAFPQLIFTREGWWYETSSVTIINLSVEEEILLSMIVLKLETRAKSSMKLEFHHVDLFNLISFLPILTIIFISIIFIIFSFIKFKSSLFIFAHTTTHCAHDNYLDAQPNWIERQF